jgi:hypothetical protein
MMPILVKKRGSNMGHIFAEIKLSNPRNPTKHLSVTSLGRYWRINAMYYPNILPFSLILKWSQSGILWRMADQ